MDDGVVALVRSARVAYNNPADPRDLMRTRAYARMPGEESNTVEQFHVSCFTAYVSCCMGGSHGSSHIDRIELIWRVPDIWFVNSRRGGAGVLARHTLSGGCSFVTPVLHLQCARAVSYTHLTLPTICSV